MRYTFRITETYYNDFEIEADSPEQAEQVLMREYEDGCLEVDYFFENSVERVKEG
jgi:hypothetical protein